MRPQGSTRPPKWPFLMGDAAMIVVAIAIWFVEERPMSDTAIVLIFSCFFLGTALAIVPFFLDFSAARQEDLIEARSQLEGLAQKLTESADIIGTVAGQLQALNDATVKAIHMAEALPYKMQEKVGELAQLVQQGDDEEKEAMAAELEELRDSESRHFEVEIEKARATLDAAVKRVEAAEKALATATASLAAAQVSPAVPAQADTPAKHAPESKPVKESHREPAEPEEESPAPAAGESNGESHDAPKHRAHAKQAKHEKPAPKSEAKPDPKPEAKHGKASHPEKKPADKESPAPPPRKKAAPKPPPDEILPGLDPVVVRDEDVDGEEGGAAKTSDGSTRLLVTAYIGIGNKVFVRGDGPGLDSEKGQPMEFVSIGKWLWQTSEATAPVTVQLYKNDEVKAMGDDITIDPGYHVEATPVFRDPNPF